MSPIILNPPETPPPSIPEQPSEPLQSLAQRLYDRWEPYHEEDAANGYVLWQLAVALTSQSEKVYEIARDTDSHQAFHVLFDPFAAPVWALRWLAMVVDVRLLPADTEQQQRNRIARAAGFYAGTTRAMREEVQEALTGTKYVGVIKTAPWALTVVTRTSETPDPDDAERRALRQKPCGVVLTMVVSDTPIIDEGGAARTIDAAGSAGTTIDATTVADVT